MYRPQHRDRPWRLVTFASLITLAAVAWGATPPAAFAAPAPPAAFAAPAPPVGLGARITIELTSDREYNEQVVWYDSENRLRRQSDVPLAVRDATTGLWSASLSFVTRSPRQKLDVAFGSAGRYARCAVWVDGVRVRERAVRGQHALTRCDTSISND
ncbi:hypothetical protein GCM10009624_22000 [Gordonia sinesedis]